MFFSFSLFWGFSSLYSDRAVDRHGVSMRDGVCDWELTAGCIWAPVPQGVCCKGRHLGRMRWLICEYYNYLLCDTSHACTADQRWMLWRVLGLLKTTSETVLGLLNILSQKVTKSSTHCVGGEWGYNAANYMTTNILTTFIFLQFLNNSRWNSLCTLLCILSHFHVKNVYLNACKSCATFSRVSLTLNHLGLFVC